MTHKEIYTKYMIEYDKANITSSYPALTKYEVATILDKAYLALIAQKVTGNNIRKSILEADVKNVSDVQPLIVSDPLVEDVDITDSNTIPRSVRAFFMPGDEQSLSDTQMLYFVSAFTIIDIKQTTPSGVMNEVEYDNYKNKLKPMDDVDNYGSQRQVEIQLTTHKIAQKFIPTVDNVPIVKSPICYIENNRFFLVLDPIINHNFNDTVILTYIKNPIKFVDDADISTSEVEFELSDSMAEELISLAISFALENVESTRLNAHLGMRGLEG